MSTIVTRAGKGSPLTHAEVDANFNNLNNDKAELNSPTFTGTVALPSSTSIGNVSSTEIGYLDGVTSAIQTQINAKGAGTVTSIIAGTGLSGGTITTSGTIAIDSTVATLTGTQTLTNKTITARVDSSASITSPLAWNSDNFDQYAATAQTSALTINADAGTPTNGRKIIFRFKDNGTARALTWTTGSSNSFRAVGVTLPTTTVINKTVYVGCVYNAADSRWDAVAVAQEA